MTEFTEPLLSAAQEQELARRIEAGVAAQAWLEGRWLSSVPLSRAEAEWLVADGRAAQDRFVRANLKLVARIAYADASRLGLNRDDLFQQGTLGLIEAVRRWDARRGLRFTTYAVPWIRMAVGELAATRNGELHLSARAGKTLQRVRGALTRAESAPGVRALDSASTERRRIEEQVAAELDLSVRATRRWLGYVAPAALNEEWADHIAVAEQPDEEPVDVARLVAELPSAERDVVRLRFGLGTPDGRQLTQAECARRLGVSERYVRRLEQRALASLRDALPLANAA